MKEEQTLNDSSQKWKKMLLGEAFEFEYGKALKKENRNSAGKYAVLGSSGHVGYHDCFLVKGPGIVVGRKGAAGEVTYVDSNFWPIDTTYYVKPKRECSLKYSYYLLKSLQLNQFEKSTAIPGLNRNDAYSKEIVLPPLEEQHRIVSKIEELFSELEKGIEELKTAQQQLKIYRQAVLKWAFEGKLTNEDVKDGELPEGWKEVSLKDIKQFSIYGPRFSSKDYSSNGVAILRTTDISDSGKVDWINAPKLELSENDYEKYKLVKNDLLITRTGSIGTISVFNDDKKAIPGAFLIHYRLQEGNNIWYLFYYLKSTAAQKHFKAYSFGVGRPNLNVPNIELLRIPLPPIEEQQQIVQEIESRLSVCDKIEETITDSLKQADALRQSILKKAFEGKLN